MNVTQNATDALNATLKVELVKEDYTERVDHTLKEYQKKAVIDGFRKGKTPMGIIRKMYGKAVLVDEINRLIGEGLTDYIRENALNILGEPLPADSQEALDLEGDRFEFTYDIAFAPEVNVKLSKREKVPYYLIRIDAEMIDKQVENILKNSGELKVVDLVEGTEYIKGDLVELDAEGNVKEGGVHNDEASMSLDFMKDEATRELFIGAQPDAEIVFNPSRAYPNKTDYAAMLGITKAEAEDITSDFRFTIREIKRFEPAEINQALFDKLYGDGVVTSEQAFRARVEEELQKNYVGHSNYRFTVDAREKMIKKNEAVELPEAFLKRWLLATNENMTEESVARDFEAYRDEFKWQMVKSALIRENNLEVTEDDLRLVARGIAEAQLQQYGLFGLSPEQLDGFAQRLLEDQKQRSNMHERALDDRIYGFIRESVKLDEQTVTMDEFQKLFENQA